MCTQVKTLNGEERGLIGSNKRQLKGALRYKSVNRGKHQDP